VSSALPDGFFAASALRAAVNWPAVQAAPTEVGYFTPAASSSFLLPYRPMAESIWASA
jgi:hypothetical protein